MRGRFQVKITETAERDIEQLWEYIAQDDPQAASKFVSELDKQLQTLERFPERCPLLPENELLGTRYRQRVIAAAGKTERRILGWFERSRPFRRGIKKIAVCQGRPQRPLAPRAPIPWAVRGG